MIDKMNHLQAQAPTRQDFNNTRALSRSSSPEQPQPLGKELDRGFESALAKQGSPLASASPRAEAKAKAPEENQALNKGVKDLTDEKQMAAALALALKPGLTPLPSPSVQGSEPNASPAPSPLAESGEKPSPEGLKIQFTPMQPGLLQTENAKNLSGSPAAPNQVVKELKDSKNLQNSQNSLNIAAHPVDISALKASASPLVFKSAQVSKGTAKQAAPEQTASSLNSNFSLSTEQLQALLAQAGQGVEGEGLMSSGGDTSEGEAQGGFTLPGGAERMVEKGMGQAAHGGLSGHDYLNTLAGLKSPTTQALNTSLKQEGTGSPGPQTMEASLGTGSIQERKKKAALAEGDAQALSLSHTASRTQAPISNLKYEINANVVPGAGARDRITTASLMSVSGEIRNLAMNGGGEIRVRLRPDNLGEMNIRVMTNGSRVGIQIQTADEKSKKIIEDSMNFLKESLSAQKLNLAQIDLSVLSGSQPSGQGQDSSSQNSSQFTQSETWNMDMNQGRSHGGSEHRSFSTRDFDGGESGRGSYRSPSLAAGAVPTSLMASQASAAQRARGRIDVTV